MICSQHSGEALTQSAFDFSERWEQFLWNRAGMLLELLPLWFELSLRLSKQSGDTDCEEEQRINIDLQSLGLYKQLLGNLCCIK